MKLRVIKEHRSNYPNPIQFNAEEQLRVGNFDNDYPGWVRVTTSDGNDGWAPADIIAIEKDKGLGTALHSYCARELNVEPGDVLTVIKEKLGWCWCEDQNGSAGWVPREIGELI